MFEKGAFQNVVHPFVRTAARQYVAKEQLFSIVRVAVQPQEPFLAKLGRAAEQFGSQLSDVFALRTVGNEFEISGHRRRAVLVAEQVERIHHLFFRRIAQQGDQRLFAVLRGDDRLAEIVGNRTLFRAFGKQCDEFLAVQRRKIRFGRLAAEFVERRLPEFFVKFGDFILPLLRGELSLVFADVLFRKFFKKFIYIGSRVHQMFSVSSMSFMSSSFLHPNSAAASSTATTFSTSERR